MEQPLTKADAERLIRRISSLPEGVWYRRHCRERMFQREIDALDVVRLLRNAEMVRDAYQREGEWRYRVRERPGNAPSWRADLEVVVAIVSDDQLQALTVYRRR
jgi:hypothetical protein